MNYLKALKERKLKVDALPKNLQSKIKQLEKLNDSIAGLDMDSLSEEDSQSVDSIKEQVVGLDSYIFHKIEIFNPDKYAEKLRVIELLNNNKKEQANQKEQLLSGTISNTQPNVHQPAPEPEQEKISVVSEKQNVDDEAPITVLEHIEEQIELQAPEPETVQHVENNQKLDEALHQLRETVKPKQAGGVIQRTEQVQEEFEKVGDAKPRKKYKGIGLMALGIFIFSAGTVIYYKE